MIYKNKDGSVYKIEVEKENETAIPCLPSNHELKLLEDKIDSIKDIVREIGEVLNYVLNKEELTVLPRPNEGGKVIKGG